MNWSQKSELQAQKILQKMFIYADNKDLNFNRIRNLIVNPQILRVLIHQLQTMCTKDKIKIIKKVADIYKQNSLNCCILFKRDREILEFNHSIFDQIITFIFAVKLEFAHNFDFFEAIKPLISGYPIGCRNVKNIINKISKNFHSENFNFQKLQLCIKILKQLYKSQTITNTQPKCFFYMYGPNSGIRLINQQLKWTLAKGMYIYINFFMQSSKHEEMNLLNIIVNNDSFQLTIDEQNYLSVKVFQGNKVNRLCKVEEKKWYFLKMAYCLRTGIIRNTYQLIAYIQGDPYQIRDLPVPDMTMQNNIEQLIIGNQFYGKINVAAISRKQVHFWPKNGINNWGQLEGLLAANKDQIKDIFLLYSPIIKSKIKQTDIVFQISSKNHAQILQNTATHNNPFDEVDINFYGGLYTSIPFFYILKFYKYGTYPNALEQMVDLLFTIFKSGYQNIENQAINCQIFGIIAQFMNQVDERYITIQVIQILGMIKNLIQSKNLKKQLLQNLLLKIRIDRIENLKVIQKIHRLITSFYDKDFTWALQVVSFYDIIWYIIDNFQPEKKQQCCLHHCWEQSPQGIQDEQIQRIQQHYKNKCIQIKQLIKYIIKSLCTTRRYDLLLPKNIQVEDMIKNFKKKTTKQTFSIFEYLKYPDYSICLKKMLLQCLLVGVQQDPKTLIKQTELLDCLYGLLAVSELRDQIVPIVSLLSQCSKVLSLIDNEKNKEIIKQIGKQLDKLYIKSYASIRRLRSKSEGVQLKKKLSQRRIFNQMQDNISCSSHLQQQNKQKQKTLKNKVIKLKKQKNKKISNDKQLYDLLTGICCVRQNQSIDYMLVDDDSTKIINPYFKICSAKFRIKLIQIIRTTVLVRSKLQNLPPKMQGLAKFDQIYRFIVSQFILKELDPDNPQYKPSQQTNYIIKNFFYIIDHMIISMKNDWDSLYLYILRLIGIIKQAKKDIHLKTQRSKEDILMASRVCIRKFILGVLKYAEKSIENMGNIVFLVYLTVFNNIQQKEQKKTHIFDYFANFQHNFFIDNIEIKDQVVYETANKKIFVDEKFILIYLDGFKMDEVFDKEQIQPSKKRRYTMNLIQAFLDKDQVNQLQDYLHKLRKVFLSKSQFKQISNGDNKGIRKIISNFMIGNQESKNKQIHDSQDFYVSTMIALLLSITVQASINTQRVSVRRQSLQKYVLFIKAFSLSCSRDGLPKKQHAYRNQKVLTSIIYNMIHFLYQLMQRADHQLKKQLKEQIKQALYEIFTFLTILMTILSQKIGNPGSLEDVTMLACVMQDVQQYNYFCFQIFKGVITLDQIRIYSTIPKKKAFDVIEHDNMKQHFKRVRTVFLQKNIKESVQIHRHNIENVEIELEQKFKNMNKKRDSSQLTNMSLSNQFEQYRLEHIRKLDYEYRNIMRVWRKVWKRLRLYHYYWSISMDQREEMKCEWDKFKVLPYKHKFGKYSDQYGLRPILQVEPREPWHVKKSQLQEQFKYRNKNFMVNLYKMDTQKNIKSKSILDILRRRSASVDYFAVQWIKHNSKRKGRLSVLNKQKLVFQYESTFQKDSHVDFTSFTLAQHRTIQKSWQLITIQNIIKRRYLMREQCLLIQFEDSSSIIFNFLNGNSDEFLTKIQQIQSEKSQMYNFMKANKIAFYTKKFNKRNYQQQIQQATQQWCQGKLSNLQYLMILNKYSGRSYLDPVNYPVIPWIISNYDYKQLLYRDLTKTLGALGSASRRQFYEKKIQAVDPFNNVPPYQYGTHYSSPGVVFNFFIRINPYTEAGRTLQGGRFDLSDRLFSSVKVCWKSVQNEVSDVRQLNPQFFYLPEIFINLDNYDFGITQVGERVNNVKLPSWCNNAYQFIYNHKRAIQNDEVSVNLQHWIDLIFGYKQKGKIARENLNLYYYLTYQDSVDLNAIDDQIQKTSIQSQIIHFGQTPSQIFFKPHPVKKLLKSQKPFSQAQKIKFMGLIETNSPIILLTQVENNLFIFNNSTLFSVQINPNFQIKQQIQLLRNSSKQGLYFIEDLQIKGKIAIFGNKKFIVVSSYVNGDLVIYNTAGKKISQNKGTPKSVIYINQRQNLLLCGCKNGLLEVYQIVYAEKQSVNLIKIISQYYMFPIQHISQGAGFFSISAGNLVIINKITRGLNYVYDKIKMQGTKMIRSFESKRKVHGSYICSNPLYCVIFFNSLEVYIYSINGQFLKLRQIQNQVDPIVMVDCFHRQSLLVLQSDGLLVLKIPELQTICSIPLPNKQYIDMKIIKNKLYLVTNNGQILYVLNQKQVIFY